MLKKALLCLFGVALFLGTGNTLFAQQDSLFTVAPPVGGVIQLHEDTKLNLRNAAELTTQELQVAFEKSSCSTAKEVESPTHCFACTGFNCTDNCYQIPCGFHVNAKDQVPPQPGFVSFVTGCTTTYVSTCDNLGTKEPCKRFEFSSAAWGNNTCINSTMYVLKSVGCI